MQIPPPGCTTGHRFSEESPDFVHSAGADPRYSIQVQRGPSRALAVRKAEGRLSSCNHRCLHGWPLRVTILPLAGLLK